MADWSRYAVGGANRPDSFTGLNPDFSSALSNMLAAAEQELGKNSLSITSAYRSPEKQAELYKAALKKYGSEKAARKWVAPPGKSMHNKGMAVDFGAAGGGLLRDANSPQAQWLKKNASRFGLAVPMSWEPWQVELAGARGKPNPNQAIASDTMRVLGKQPKGLLTAPQTTNDTESNMTPEQAPKGLLGSLGIQKMVEGAEGDAGQRFYNRQSFGDTMAALAPALGRMGVMGLDVPAQAVADRRFAERDREQKASKTIEALSRMNTPQAKQALEYLSAGGDPVAALQMAFGKSEGKVRQVTGASMGMTGPNADKLYNLSADGKLTPIGGSAPVTNIYPGSKGTGKFEELDASTLSDASSAAMAASRSLSQIDRLGDLLSNVDTGAAASLQSLAGSFGIKTEGLSDIQAAEALISALVPQQRQAGSGPMSDEDLKLFKKSLPQLMNTPEGNRIILQTLRGLAEYDVLGGQIVQQYRRNPEEFTQADAFDALLARPDPFAQFRIAVPQPNAQPNVTPSGSQTTSTGITFQIKR